MLRSMLIKTFNNADLNKINEIEKIFNDYGKIFNLDTPLRQAQFLAQMKAEVGNNLGIIRENLNYKAEVLPKLFKNFTNELAQKYGRTSTHPANQEMIANIAYANRLGNGDVQSGDGWTYRGMGSLQITGKLNFANVSKEIFNKTGHVFLINQVETFKGFVLIGFGFWSLNKLHLKADTGNPDEVTKIINLYSDSYTKRKQYFYDIKRYI